MDGPGFDQFAVIGECFSLTSGLFLVLKWILKVTSSVNGEIWSDLDTAFGGVFTEGLGFTRHESLSSMEKPPHRDGLNEKKYCLPVHDPLDRDAERDALTRRADTPPPDEPEERRPYPV